MAIGFPTRLVQISQCVAYYIYQISYYRHPILDGERPKNIKNSAQQLPSREIRTNFPAPLLSAQRATFDISAHLSGDARIVILSNILRAMRHLVDFF